MKRLSQLLAILATGCFESACAHDHDLQLDGINERIADRVLGSTLLVESAFGHGSGWVFDNSMVATAAHVVDKGVTAVKMRDGSECTVDGVDISIKEDIALVHVSECDLRPLRLRKRDAHEGMVVHIAGNPLYEEWSYASGTVMDADAYGGSRIMLDAVGLPGMSGGPVVDARGRVVGIAVSIHASAGRAGYAWGGETFAVPIDAVLQFALDGD